MSYKNLMNPINYLALFMVLTLSACSNKKNGEIADATKSDVSFWLTKGDKSALLAKQNTVLNFIEATNSNPTIVVNEKESFQTIDGFGYTLTGGSASLINGLAETEKDALLQELFSPEGNGIGINYLRVSIGASDLSASTFTYNELPAGETDVNQDKFAMAMEMTDLIPILKKIVKINPAIKILGSPWTAPTWMKDNKSFKGGSLKPEYYQSFARYFAKYIKAMAELGITIDAVTIQNEPLHPGNVPSMYMEAPDQANFIKTALGPLFKAEGLKTKIILYDHNADKPEYPISILDDPEAKKYVDGSAFHLYGGTIDALSKVHDAHPDKNIYFTEQWVGGPGNFAEDLKWHVSTLIIGATRNWSKNVLEWNLAADPGYGPHTDGGCVTCLGALTIGQSVTRNVAYYVIAHASKFVPQNSTRIASNNIESLPNVAFKTPEGKKVLIVTNTGTAEQNFNIKSEGKMVSVSLPAGAAGTFVW
ncbi:glucosylceramidase [Pedobacter sp. CG_S7]|uniref:glycoside hydrolase family 30 protein n=1 Tax=Pedobacter sp. CG_S7 TaxID=3143930 RepID=UPI00339ADA92